MSNTLYDKSGTCMIHRFILLIVSVINILPVFFVLYTAALARPGHNPVTRIMPLGNSITCDNNIDQSPPINLKEAYRSQLYRKLAKAGYNIDFVGSRKDGFGVVPAFDAHHEGWPGWTVNGLKDHVYKWLTMNTPDVILLHIGTNGANWSEKPGELDSLLAEIDRFEKEQRHKIIVLLAKIIQTKYHNENIALYNRQLDSIASARILQGDKIRIVDMPGDAGLMEEDYYDDLHPNAKGYAKMANVWYAELKNILKVGIFVSFSAAPQYITSRQQATLAWEIFGKRPAELFLNGKPISAKGTMAVTPDNSMEYTLTGKAVDGTAFEKSLAIKVVDISVIHLRLNSWGPGNERESGDISTDGGAVWNSSLPYLVGGGNFFDFKRFTKDTVPGNYAELINPAPAAAYFSVTHNNHAYDFPMLPNGIYTVRLHLFDLWGLRAMNFFFEDRKILEGVGTSPLNAAIVEFPIEISDNNGLLMVADKGAGDDVFESAIEIIGSPHARPSINFTARTQNTYEGIRQALPFLASLSDSVEKRVKHGGLRARMLKQISSAVNHTEHNRQEESIRALNRLLRFTRTKRNIKRIGNRALHSQLVHLMEDCIIAVKNNVEAVTILSHAAERDVTVQLRVSGTAGAKDHTLGAGPIELAVPAGKTHGSVQFNIIDDNEIEMFETIVLTMDSPVNATLTRYSPMTAQVFTIIENDLKVADIRIPQSRLRLGDTLTVSLFDQTGREFTGPADINWAVHGVPYTQVNNRTIVFTGDLRESASVTVTSGKLSDSKTVELIDADDIWIRLNTGAHRSAHPFSADEYGSGGTPSTKANAIDMSGVRDRDPAPQALYQSERYGNSTYTFTNLVPSEKYIVRLHFAELFQTKEGDRLFNVDINGVRVLSDFDVYAITGARYKAHIREFTATANESGVIAIEFKTIRDNATISGIEIIG